MNIEIVFENEVQSFLDNNKLVFLDFKYDN